MCVLHKIGERTCFLSIKTLKIGAVNEICIIFAS